MIPRLVFGIVMGVTYAAVFAIVFASAVNLRTVPLQTHIHMGSAR